MIFGQPPETATISFEGSRSMVWVIESFTADPLDSISIVHSDSPSALSSGLNWFCQRITKRRGGSASTISPASVMLPLGCTIFHEDPGVHALSQCVPNQYCFGTHCESAWTPGSSWKMVHPNGSITDAGEIVEAEPPRRLVIRWQNQFKPELKAEGESLCTMEIESSGSAVKLSITHTIERDPSKLIVAVSGGWPKIISNLKSLLETGSAVLQEPYPTSVQR